MKFLTIILMLSLFIQCNLSVSKKAIELNERGLKYLQDGNESEAIKSFKGALKVSGISNQTRSEILRNLGIADKQVLQKDTSLYFEYSDSAKYYFLQAASLNADTSYLYLINMAEAYLIDKKINKSLGYLESAWRIDSNSLAINNLLGLIYLGEQDPKYINAEKALRYNLYISKYYPGRISKSNLAKNYYLLKDYEEAKKMYRELLKEFPQFPAYLISVIMIDEEQGRSEEQEKSLDTLRQQYPKAYSKYIKWKNSSVRN